MKRLINNKFSFLSLITLFITFTVYFFVIKNQDYLKPPVHILMPAYNADEFILKTIQSVLNQNYPNLKLFIIDDGSNDKTLEKVQTFIEKSPTLKTKIYLKSIPYNRGVSQTRIELIRWSKSFDPQAYIFWLDADDQYTTKTFVYDVISSLPISFIECLSCQGKIL